MKKFLILIMTLLIVSGCENVDNMQIEDAIQLFEINPNKENTYRVGYKYHLPRGMQVINNTLYNEVISNSEYNFYLYVDILSYSNKVENKYEVNSEAFYSEKYEFDEKIGYLEINNIENDEYLIEIMYNYAKIEVMVKEVDIVEGLIYSVNLLKSITYNSSSIEEIITNDELDGKEEEFNIFNTTATDDSYLDFNSTYGDYVPLEEEYDQDYIR